MLGRVTESLLVGAMGGGLALVTFTAIGLDGLIVVSVIVATANGVIAGAVGLYSWHRGKGWLFFVLDSTWGLLGNALALVLHVVNVFSADRGYVVDMIRRTNRHVYENGFGLRRDFALALGNVISNAGGQVGLREESARVAKRRQFVVAHEGVHVLQNRLFGPLYQLVYVAWMVVASVVAVAVWVARERSGLGRIIETMAYYDNPFEYWAYKNDGYWPPKGVHPRYAWGGGDTTEVL